jgi:hypothetical protein
MATRRTRVTLSIPWDDEVEDHPSGWGYDVLLERDGEVYVVDFEEVNPTTGELATPNNDQEPV